MKSKTKIDEIELLGKEWLESQPRFSDRELLLIFPEAKPFSKEKLKENQKAFKILSSEIRNDLKRIYDKKIDEFTRWFLVKIVELWKGEKLNWLDKEIRKWEYLLNPQIKKSKIDDSMIERAKDYSFKDLVGTKKDFILCPFHSEKRASFYIKNNWGYCFACGWHGDTIKFLMERDGLTFQEAVKYLT